MVAIPVGLFMNTQHANDSVTYRWQGESVSFNGNNVVIGFGNHLYPVSWTVTKLSPPSGNTVSPMVSLSIPSINEVNMTHYSYKRIFNSYQNSAVLTESGNGIRVAEIYSFLNNGIDASISIENMGNTSGMYAGTFVLQAHAHKHASLFGYNPKAISQSIHSNTRGYMINSNQWEICQGNISVNWQQEISIFHLGTLVSNRLGSAISLPFGPINLNPRETYSIDPVIRPMVISGGGGGGGSTAAQVRFTESGLPSGTSWSVTMNGHYSYSTSSSIYFNEVTGKSYLYTIGTVSGYTSSPSSGYAYVGNGGYIVGVTFKPNAATYYSVNFDQSGLPSGVLWYVTLNGQMKSSTSSTMSFVELSGTYSYSIQKATGPMGKYSPSTSSGTAIVQGNTVVNVGFTLTDMRHMISFTESGLPPNTDWGIFFNNSVLECAQSGQSMNFSAYNGTYTYKVYTNPINNGTIYWAQSGTVQTTGSSQIIRANIDYSVTIGHLTVASGTCGLGAESHFYQAQLGLNLSISYTNASGNIPGDGISFYALTSGGTKILLSDPVSGGGSVSLIPVTGSGTTKWTWDDLPGYYTGFEAIMTYGGNSTVPQKSTISISIPYNTYIFDTFPAAGPTSVYYGDTLGVGKIFNTSTGQIIANITQDISGGPNNILNPHDYPSNGYTFTGSIDKGNKTDTSIGVWNETQTFSYVNNTDGISSTSCSFVENCNLGSFVQGVSPGKNTNKNGYTAKEELWYAMALALQFIGLLVIPPYDIAIEGASLVMDGFGMFFFATAQTHSSSKSFSYNTISNTINGTTETISPPYHGRINPNTQYPVAYIPIENASGGISVVFGFNDSVGIDSTSSGPTLNFFTYIESVTLMNVNYNQATGNYNYVVPYPASISKVPTYSTAISLPVYLASNS